MGVTLPAGSRAQPWGQAAFRSGTPARLGRSHSNSCFVFSLCFFVVVVAQKPVLRSGWGGAGGWARPSPLGAEPHAVPTGSPAGPIPWSSECQPQGLVLLPSCSGTACPRRGRRGLVGPSAGAGLTCPEGLQRSPGTAKASSQRSPRRERAPSWLCVAAALRRTRSHLGQRQERGGRASAGPVVALHAPGQGEAGGHCHGGLPGLFLPVSKLGTAGPGLSHACGRSC